MKLVDDETLRDMNGDANVQLAFDVLDYLKERGIGPVQAMMALTMALGIGLRVICREHDEATFHQGVEGCSAMLHSTPSILKPTVKH